MSTTARSSAVVAVPTLSAIAAASDGGVFGVDGHGNAYQMTSAQPAGTGTWKGLTGSVALARISAASGGVSTGTGMDVWGVTAGGAVYRSQGATWNPQPVAGTLNQVSAAADGTVWGVNGGLPYQYTGGTSNPWTQQACQVQLKLVAVGGAGMVFGIDAGGNLFQCTGTATWSSLATAPAVQLTEVSASADGLLWALDANHDLWLYTGPDGAWYPAASGLTHVSAASASVIVGVDTYGDPVLLAMGTAIFSEDPPATGDRLPPRWETKSAFDQTRSTHLWIVYQAATLAALAGPQGQAAKALVKPQPPSAKTAIGDPFHDRLCEGLYDADYKDPWRDPIWVLDRLPFVGDKLVTYKSHFYDPDTGKNWRGDTDPTALTRGRAVSAYALDCYLSGDLANAGYYLGLSLHYLTDVAQAMHAGNFTHLSSDPWGWHSEFEARVLALTGSGSVTPPSTYTPSSATDFDGVLVAAAHNAKTKYLAQICPPLVTKPNVTVVEGHLVITRSWETDTDAVWTTNALPAVAPMLRDAITYAAQFLVAWSTVAQTGAQMSFMVCSDSGRVLNLPRIVVVSGVPLQQLAFNGGTNQQWMAVPLTGVDAGYYRLTWRLSSGTPVVLDASHQGTAAGTPIISWGWNNGDNQKWTPLEQPDGSLKWCGKQSGLLLTVANVTQQGSGIALQPDDGRPGQRWLSPPAEVDMLICTAGSLVLDVPHGTGQPGTALRLWDSNGNTNQQFTFVPIESDTINEEDEVFAILSACSGLALDVNPTTNQLIQSSWSGSTSQRWRRTPLVRGAATVISLENVAHPGSLIGSAGAGTSKGEAVVLGAENGQPRQLWAVKPVHQ